MAHHANLGTRPPVTDFTSGDEGIGPILISVKRAAEAVGLSTWQMYQLTSGDQPEIRVRYRGSRKLVEVDSLKQWASNLPTERPAESA